MRTIPLARTVTLTLSFALLLASCGGMAPDTAGMNGSGQAAPEPPTEIALSPIISPSDPPTALVQSQAVTPTIEPEPVVLTKSNNDSIAIMVIDDYDQQASPNTDRNGAQPWFSASSGNCIVKPDGQHYATGGAGTESSSVPHGRLVADQLRSTLEEIHDNAPIKAAVLPTRPDGTPYDGLRAIDLQDTDAGRILLIQLDTNAWTTEEAADRVRSVSEGILSVTGTQLFVLNMSFAVIPCNIDFYRDPLKDPEILKECYNQLVKPDTALKTLQEVVSGEDASQDAEARLVLANKEQCASEVAPSPSSSPTASGAADRPARKVTLGGSTILGSQQPVETDPLNNLINRAGPPPPPSTVPFYAGVAASGNFGMRFPFAPGLWPNVISVSASASPDRALSNDGEVALNGQYLQDGGIYGTSFAAPRFSALLASYFLNSGNVRCAGSLGETSPPLDYADQSGWQNKSLVDAAREYCKGFPTISLR